MELESRHLRVVCAIAETGSVSKAAARLGVSQPSLTAQLHRIEKAVGGPLFSRGRKGAEPTDLGRFVVGRARAVLAELESLTGSVGEVGTADAIPARLRLGGVPGHIMSNLYVRLGELLPGSEITSEVNQSAKLLVQLLATDRLDVGLVDDYPEFPLEYPAGLEHRVLIPREPIYVAIPTSHPSAYKESVDIAELEGKTWIVDPEIDSENGELALLRAACEAAGHTPILGHFGADSTTARDLVSNDQGVCLFLPLARVFPGMVILPITGDPIARRLIMVWRRRFASPPFADLLFRAAAEAYVAGVESGTRYAAWWAAHPEVHPF